MESKMAFSISYDGFKRELDAAERNFKTFDEIVG